MLFAKALKGQDVGALLANIGTAGGAAGPAAAGPADTAAAAEAPKEEDKKKDDEPEDVDMGGLFGDDDDY